MFEGELGDMDRPLSTVSRRGLFREFSKMGRLRFLFQDWLLVLLLLLWLLLFRARLGYMVHMLELGFIKSAKLDFMILWACFSSRKASGSWLGLRRGASSSSGP